MQEIPSDPLPTFEALKLESTDKLLPGTDMSKQVTFHGKVSRIDDVLTC